MTAPASFAAAYERYSGSNRDTRARLWELCVATYTESQTVSCAKLADSIRTNKSSVEDWATVGWLIDYCGYIPRYKAEDGREWCMLNMWHASNALSYDHLLRMAKLAKQFEIDPAVVLELLYHSMDGGLKAETMQRNVEEMVMLPAILLRRDLKRIGKRLQQNISSLEFRGASNRLVRAFRILERRMAQELARLEAE
jgi:hypothetical protein